MPYPSPYGQPPGFAPLSEEEVLQEKGTTGYDLPEIVYQISQISSRETSSSSSDKNSYESMVGSHTGFKNRPKAQREKIRTCCGVAVDSRTVKRCWLVGIPALALLATILFWIIWATVRRHPSSSPLTNSTATSTSSSYNWPGMLSTLSSLESQYTVLGASASSDFAQPLVTATTVTTDIVASVTSRPTTVASSSGAAATLTTSTVSHVSASATLIAKRVLAGRHNLRLRKVAIRPHVALL